MYGVNGAVEHMAMQTRSLQQGNETCVKTVVSSLPFWDSRVATSDGATSAHMVTRELKKVALLMGDGSAKLRKLRLNMIRLCCSKE